MMYIQLSESGNFWRLIINQEMVAESTTVYASVALAIENAMKTAELLGIDYRDNQNRIV